MRAEFLDNLSEGALLALPYLFEFWAMPHQMPPEGDWRSWVILGGRGAGKTRAGAEWVRSMVEGARPLDPGRARRVALVGETLEQVREVMVMGESGILACSPPDRRPVWEASRRRLVWPNGAVATCHSGHDPESLRGPQFDAAWVDELAKWKRAEEAWDMLQFCLRLGDDPRQCVTTTPRNVEVLKRLLAAEGTVRTHAPTEANRANLAGSFLADVMQRYAQTRLGRQELEGELLEDVEGALWTRAMLDLCRIRSAPGLRRVVVAVDPPVTGGARADACGIVVAGVTAEGRGVVLEDASVAGASPAAWAEAAVAAYRRHGADRLVAEVNQGGDLVEQVVRQVDRTVSYRGVHASHGKVARAEPVAALYEQDRVWHLAGLQALEAQMCQMAVGGFRGAGSPDRVDALVWALSELMLRRDARPGVRSL
ncbi:phage DNA Packaging Protein [Oceaniovalibus guishaninsula JLT2003]|uniref:Phage DNA Packaging Protein n=1 Tax=Oceaniovalibus guishaninsula JLT2003 TaxID=1231392 RepID=K2GLU3_9RHOB|nr:phage DNA Packaging Protein [Oceaniovalibus guishaninsula JLT2003]